MLGQAGAVLFDVGGVIANQDTRAADKGYRSLRPDLDTHTVNAKRHGAELYPLWLAYSVGEIDARAYWSAVARALDLEESRADDLQRVHGDTAWARRDPGVAGVIARLRAVPALRLGVLSNSAPEYERHIPAFAAPFHVLHFSHRTRRRKPEPAAYLAACADLAADLADVVFVDDKARNVTAAAGLGLRAVRFENAAALEGALRDLGLPLPDVGPGRDGA